jgi:PAS domain S-box-containing protein
VDIFTGEEGLRVTLASIRDGVIATDPDGRVVFLNPVAQSLTGWSPEEALGQPLDRVFRIVNEHTREEAENPATRALREGTVVGLANHTLLVARDGTERPFDASAAPIRNAQGQVVRVVLTFRDITEQRRAEWLAEDARSYAESIVATVREPLVILDGDLRVRTANRSFYRTFGVSPEETEGRLLYDLGNRQWHIPALRKLLGEVLPQNTAFNDFEVEHDFPAIGRKVMLLNARRICQKGNHTELILLAIEDVTAFREAERRRQEVETRFTEMVKNVRDHSIFLTDPEGRITFWNVAAERVIGYTEAEALGRHFSMIFTPEDLRNGLPEHELRQAREDGRAEDERWHVKKDGTRFWALGIVTPLHDASKRLTGFSKILRDITERKKANDLLREQAEALREADRRKNEFLAMLGHELRNPLAAIQSAAEVLQAAGPAEGRPRRAAEIIDAQARQLSVLVDDLLDVARITQGKIELHKREVELAAVVALAVETARPLLDARRHQFTLTVPPGAIRLEADPTRLAQAVTNLLVNAAKYTEEGGRVSLVVQREGPAAVLRVLDTGVGIPPEQWSSVFELFTQLGRSPDRSQGGLGIGLAVARRLVEMHGGSVTASSEGPGRGSEFTVRLPILPDVPKPVRGPGEGPAVSTAGRRVLVVDDNPEVAESLVMLLEVGGHEVRTAHDGPTALQMAEQFRPEAMLVDIGLPKMDGWEVARRLRQMPGQGQVFLAAVSGYADEEHRRKSQEAGFDRHLVKPVTLNDLQALFAASPPATR